jgi:hypothetical protein
VHSLLSIFRMFDYDTLYGYKLLTTSNLCMESSCNIIKPLCLHHPTYMYLLCSKFCHDIYEKKPHLSNHHITSNIMHGTMLQLMSTMLFFFAPFFAPQCRIGGLVSAVGPHFGSPPPPHPPQQSPTLHLRADLLCRWR